jgi:hypothetical protein
MHGSRACAKQDIQLDALENDGHHFTPANPGRSRNNAAHAPWLPPFNGASTTGNEYPYRSSGPLTGSSATINGFTPKRSSDR